MVFIYFQAFFTPSGSLSILNPESEYVKFLEIQIRQKGSI